MQKANSRSKQLQCYKGNWATLEILKTLLKNLCIYQNCIGSLDQQDEQDIKKEIKGEEVEGGNDRNNSDDNKNSDNKDDNQNNDNNDQNNNNNDQNNDNDSSWENMYVKNKLVDSDEDDNGGKDGGEDEDGDGDRAGMKMKRKVDDKPATATRAKRKKMDGSRGQQVATLSMKRALLKRKYQ